MFKTEREAAEVRDRAAQQAFGRFAHLKFPNPTPWHRLMARIKEQIAKVLGILREHRSGP